MIDNIAFDRIITHKDADKHIVANTYLHILSAHRYFIKKNNLSKKNKFWMPVRDKLVLIIRTFQSIFDGSYYCTRQKSFKSDVLFISHLTNKQQVSKDNDAYFGGLPSQLLQNGIGSSVILINHAKVSKKQVLTGWSGSSIPRFILGPSLGFLSEIKLYFAQRNSKKKLKSILKDLKIDKELAKELTIEAFGKAFNKLHSYTQQYAFSTWLFSIARNNCIDYLRKKKLPTFSIDAMIEHGEGSQTSIDIPDHSEGPEKKMMNKQRIQILRNIVEQLKPNYRALVKL